MRIVRCNDKYAIAKGFWFFTFFRDLKSDGTFWWGRSDYNYKDCWGSLERVEEVLSIKPQRYETFRKL